MLFFVRMGNFSPVDRDEIQEIEPKWWNINLYRSRLLNGFLEFCNFTTTTGVEKHTGHTLCHFCLYVPIAKLFCPKLNGSSRSPALERSYGIVFIPVAEISVAKCEISVTGPARLLIRTKSKFYEEKSGEASQPCWPGSYEEVRVRVAKAVKIQSRLAWNNLYVSFLKLS